MTQNENAQLIALYETDGWKAVRKLMALQQLSIAQTGLSSQNMHQLGMHQGQVMALRWLDDEVRRRYVRHMNKGKKGK